MLKHLGILTLFTFIGGLGGIVLAVLFLRGWFSPWRSVESPPTRAAKLMALDESNLWVSGVDGKIYFNPMTDTCAQTCWALVEKIERQPVPAERSYLTKSCLPPPPLMGVVEIISECKVGQWQDQNTDYALRTDGSIRVWRFTSGGEWGAVMIIMAAIVGASLSFAITLAIMFFIAIVNSANKPPTANSNK